MHVNWLVWLVLVGFLGIADNLDQIMCRWINPSVIQNRGRCQHVFGCHLGLIIDGIVEYWTPILGLLGFCQYLHIIVDLIGVAAAAGAAQLLHPISLSNALINLSSRCLAVFCIWLITNAVLAVSSDPG